MGDIRTSYNKARVQQFVDWYEKLHPTGPDSIAWAILDAKRDQEQLILAGNVDKNGVLMQSKSGRRQLFTMPTGLYVGLQKKFPTIFKADLKNFKRDFPVFFEAWKP